MSDFNEIAAYLKENKVEITETKLTPKNLAELISLIEKGTISNNIGKQIIIEMLKDGTKASVIVEKKGLSQITDEGAIKEVVSKILEANPQSIADYKAGKNRALEFLVGQAMKETKGKANPKMLNEMFLAELNK